MIPYDTPLAVTNTDELCKILAIPNCSVPTNYPLLVPRPFIDLMERSNPNDPLLLQVLPSSEENQNRPGFSQDPLGETALVQENIILNKYEGRSLLLISPDCAVHCRFCFRRATRSAVKTQKICLPKLTNTMNNGPEEIILSGGDPLMLDDDALDRLLQSIVQAGYVRRIRLHTRLPIVLPERLTPQLASVLTLPIPVYLVLHINHPNELSAEFLERRALLTWPIVMSQTVLLRRINDDSETLYRLFRRLIDARIIPYYLHQLDRVSGSAHFEVEPAKGLHIVSELRERLPGYAVPVYVREEPGKKCKSVML